MNKETYDNEVDEHRYKYNKMVLVNIIQLFLIFVLTGAVVFFAMNQKIILKSPYTTNKDEIIADGFEDLERLNHFSYYISNLTQNITNFNANDRFHFL